MSTVRQQIKNAFTWAKDHVELKKDLFDDIYPVGSVYMSLSNTQNPNTLFKGTWVKLEDRFLAGSGTTIGVPGATGGSSTVQLTVNELPSHTHTQQAHNHKQEAHNHTQNPHNHTQNAHSHGATVGKGFATTTTNDANLHTANGNTIDGSGRKYGYSDNGEWKYATNTADATATNQDSTATNNATTAVNKAATAVNDYTGNGAAFSILPPYIAVAIWYRTA